MTRNRKIELLRLNGWKEVPADNGETGWMAPEHAAGEMVFDLDSAYHTITKGTLGNYVQERIIGDMLQQGDIARMEAAERARFAATGVLRGVPPNY